MADFADWREDSKSGSSKFGAKVAPVEEEKSSWWQTALLGLSPTFGTGSMDIDTTTANRENQERIEAEKGELLDRQLLFTNPADLGIIQGENETDREFEQREGLNNIFEWRDAVLMGIAERGYDLYSDQLDPRLQYANPIGPPEKPLFTDPAGSSGGSGRGGSAGPVYTPPDRRVVEEFVGDKMIVLTGKRQPELSKIVDAYMTAHRQQWEGKSIDPQAEVQERIRGLAEYKRIHTLRDEAMDENTWVNQRTNRLLQLGLGSGEAASRGIDLAVTGANVNDIQTGKFEFGRGGKDISMIRRLEKVAEQIGGTL